MDWKPALNHQSTADSRRLVESRRFGYSRIKKACFLGVKDEQLVHMSRQAFEALLQAEDVVLVKVAVPKHFGYPFILVFAGELGVFVS